MKKESFFRWKRIITFVILIYGVLKFVGHFYSIFYAYFQVRNPLIPGYFEKYIAFPHYFLIPIWGVGLWMGWRFYRNEKLMTERFWLIFVGLILIMALEIGLYQVLMRFNPYGG